MQSVEVEGESIDDAIRKALTELGITRERAAIEILNDARRGILGFGGQKARVRATVRAPLAASLSEIDARVAPPVSRETERPRAPSEAAERRSPRTSARAPELPRRVSRETKPEQRGLAPNVARAPAPAPAPPPSPAVVVPGDLGARSRDVLVELLSHMGVRCEVSCGRGTDGGVVSLAVSGESSALLIGKHGQTLDAIEYLLNRILVREASSSARIEVDVEGYRLRREQSLISAARRMADKVRQTGRPATVDLMNPRDRRIVHMALKDEGGVTSRSQGEGFLRKLVILPAGKRRNGPRPARDGE